MFASSLRFPSLVAVGAAFFLLVGCGEGDAPAPGSDGTDGSDSSSNTDPATTTPTTTTPTTTTPTTTTPTTTTPTTTTPGTSTAAGSDCTVGGTPCVEGYECTTHEGLQNTACLPKIGSTCGETAKTQCANNDAICQVPISSVTEGQGEQEDTYTRASGGTVCCIPLGGKASKKEDCCDAALVEDIAEGTEGTCTLKDDFEDNPPCGYEGNECCLEERASNSSVEICAGTDDQKLTCAQPSTASGTSVSNEGTTCRPCGGFNQYKCTVVGTETGCNDGLVVKDSSEGFDVCCNSADEEGCDGSASLESGQTTADSETEDVSSLAKTCASYKDCASCINARYACGFCNGECIPVDANTRTPLDDSSSSSPSSSEEEQEETEETANEVSSTESATKSTGSASCSYNPNNPKAGLILHEMSCGDFSISSGTSSPDTADESTSTETNANQTNPEPWVIDED